MADPRARLIEKFPEMEPTFQPPTLSTVNGIGTMAYGDRDRDDETQTYVRTVVFAIFFLPLFALKAYRVADAPGGGCFFFGRVPLSFAAKAWNGLMAASLVASGLAIWWNVHTSSPTYRGRHLLAKGDELQSAGQLREAADQYLQAGALVPDEVRERFETLVDAPLGDDPNRDVTLFWRTLVVADLRWKLKDFSARSIARAESLVEGQPLVALQILDALQTHDPNAPNLNAALEKAAAKAVAQAPDNVDAVSRWASILESRREFAECEKLLAPLAGKLEASEGARILGQILARAGKFDEADALLRPYLDARLSQFLAAESAVRGVEMSIFDGLRTGKADDFNFPAFKRAGKTEQDQMLRAYMTEKLATSPDMARSVAELRRQSGVVGAALDYGIVILGRAQGLAGEKRQAELERAEKMFLAIQGAAGGGPEFKLTLGQVYYWMGKRAEGGKLFDEIAESPNVPAKLQLTRILRELGEHKRSAKLAEAGFAAAIDARDRYDFAMVRALVHDSLDDRIEWLDKCDPKNPQTQASLAEARGDRAALAGKTDEAVREYRKAVAVYDGEPVNASTLNNSAIALGALGRATGDATHFREALVRLDKAVALLPRDAVLLHNVADSHLAHAVSEAIGDALDRKILKSQGSLGDLTFLYADAKGRDAWAQKLRQSEGVKRATELYERLLVLAPSNPRPYETLHRLHRTARNETATADLAKKAAEATFDTSRIDFTTDPVKREKLVADLRAGLVLATKVCDAARVRGGATYARALNRRIELQFGVAELAPTEKFDWDAVLAECEAAHLGAPSVGARAEVAIVRLQRAHVRLLRENAEYAKAAEPIRSKVGGGYLIAWFKTRGGPLGKTLAADKDVIAAAQIYVDQSKMLGGFSDEWDCALCRDLVTAAERDALEQTLRRSGDLQGRVSGSDSIRTISEVWRHERLGDAVAARAHYDAQKSAKVPLPEWR